jgi:peptide/nickel transport system permease protein
MSSDFKRRLPGPLFWLSLAWIVLAAGLALFADWLPLVPFEQMDFSHPAAAPGTVSMESGGIHLLGTDTLGRDVISRLIFGSRVSLTVGLVAPAIGMAIGGFLGMLAGFYRGRTESMIMGAMDVILAFPALVLLLAMAFYIGRGMGNLLITLGFLSVPAFCRVARASTLAISQREFVTAARMLGTTDTAILLKEVLPNIFAGLAVYGLFVAAHMIVAEGALSFLGLGIPPPTPSWGGMIAEGKEVLEEAPHLSLMPAGAMFLTVLSLNLMGDILRRFLDSREGQL